MSLSFSNGSSSQSKVMSTQKTAAAVSTTTIGEYSPPNNSRARSRFSMGGDHDEDDQRWQHLYVLPVLLLEFLALALTRAVLPSMLVNQYGDSVYVVMGVADCIRGLLAFFACPLFGKLSDVVGRKVCLFVTVTGTLAPVCCLAFFSWETTLVYPDHTDSTVATTSKESTGLEPDDSSDSSGFWPMIWGSFRSSSDESGIHEGVQYDENLHPHAITTFVVLLALSGVFSSTFTLVFAYINDTVHQQEERVSAYGLALATFGLSFTIGPIVGGYLAQSHKQYVFAASFVLSVLDLVYIHVFLPESNPSRISVKDSLAQQHLSWNPIDTLRLLINDSFLRKVSKVAFFYYTGLWALISTFSVYAVKRFHLGPERLGELMSALGLCTMVAEAVLVRIMVPMFGEKQSMKIGLVSFAVQCIVLGFAYESWHLFVCAFFSLLGNLVYPSLSSLVSGSVEPDSVGEALGAVNGIKSLTEGIGPLIFGSLMTISEKSAIPGWPYLLAALLVVFAYQATDELPDPDDDENEYIHELERKRTKRAWPRSKVMSPSSVGSGQSASPIMSSSQASSTSPVMDSLRGLWSSVSTRHGEVTLEDELEDDVELECLLSEIDEGTDSENDNSWIVEVPRPEN